MVLSCMCPHSPNFNDTLLHDSKLYKLNCASRSMLLQVFRFGVLLKRSHHFCVFPQLFPSSCPALALLFPGSSPALFPPVSPALPQLLPSSGSSPRLYCSSPRIYARLLAVLLSRLVVHAKTIVQAQVAARSCFLCCCRGLLT